MTSDRYACDDCGETTSASSCPPYCPACEAWGTMREATIRDGTFDEAFADARSNGTEAEW